MKRIALSVMAVLAVALPLLASYTPQEAVNKFVSHNSLRYASVGVQVIDLDSAKSIASYRPEQANITASTMKTVVSSAALGLMGPHFRFETPVYLDGEVRNGCLYGNLIVKGMGDPTLGSVFLPCQANIVEEVIAALRALGVNRIEGDVICDDSYYGYPYYDEDWDVGDLAYDYGAAVHALNFHDNLVTVSYTFDGRGRVSHFSFSPAVPGLKVISRCRGSRGRNAITPYDSNFHNSFIIFYSLMRALRSNGFELLAASEAPAGPRGELSLLVVHKSPELTEIITSLLDRSDNMFAHALLRAIGARDYETRGMDAMPVDLDVVGVEAVKRWLELQGVNTEPLFMRDGSGLARANKASVNFFGDMLSMMADRRFDGVRLCDLMPTASDRVGKTLENNPLSSRIVLKSGSMRHVRCFVGYYPADKPRYAFAVLVNNFTCSQASVKEQIGTFLCNLFEGK